MQMIPTAYLIYDEYIEEFVIAIDPKLILGDLNDAIIYNTREQAERKIEEIYADNHSANNDYSFIVIKD